MESNFSPQSEMPQLDYIQGAPVGEGVKVSSTILIKPYYFR